MSNEALLPAFQAFEAAVNEDKGQPMAVIVIMVPMAGGQPDMLSNTDDALDIMAFCVHHAASAESAVLVGVPKEEMN